MKLPEEELFKDVCTDVVIRFKSHNAYKGRAGALKAFMKRAPGQDALIYETAFDKFCNVYDLGVAAIEMFPSNIQQKSKYADIEDINFEKCLEHMEQGLPGYGNDIKPKILNWIIFWHYLK